MYTSSHCLVQEIGPPNRQEGVGADLHGNVCRRRRNDVTAAIKGKGPESTGFLAQRGRESLPRGLSLSCGSGEAGPGGEVAPSLVGQTGRILPEALLFVDLGMEPRALHVANNGSPKGDCHTPASVIIIS